MKKNNKNSKSPTRSRKIRRADRVTIGMDLGDKTSRYCALNAAGEVIQEGACATTKKGMAQMFAQMPCCRIAIEVGATRRG